MVGLIKGCVRLFVSVDKWVKYENECGAISSRFDLTDEHFLCVCVFAGTAACTGSFLQWRRRSKPPAVPVKPGSAVPSWPT